MKKQKKKLTPRQKEELKAKLKKATLTMLHVISYICTALFVLVCVVACIQSCNTNKKSSNATPQQNNAPVVSRALVPQRASEEAKLEASDRYFYPVDVKATSSHVLNLNFSNYNYLPYFMPSYYDSTHYSNVLTDYLVANEYIEVDFVLGTINDNGEISNGLHLPNDNIEISFKWLRVSIDYIDSYLTFKLVDNNNLEYLLYEVGTEGDNDYILGGTWRGYTFYDIFDFVFTSNKVIARLHPNENTNEDKALASFLYYYLSTKSFDYNAYVFGGLEKYVSFMSLFRRVYNGFFIYYPEHDQPIYTLPLFKGAWEYKNVIYDTITITIQRAWSGSYVSNNITYDYDVIYTPPANNITFFEDIFNGDNEALTNYYFIRNIEMVSVYGERVTLAYNRVSGKVINQVITYMVFPSNNLRLWADDSFLNNNNIEFVLYSIDYDYTFNMDSNLFTVYKAYSDFFFTAFYYTGLYHTTKPNVTDSDIQVLVPVISMLALALTGMLPLLNVYLLPGVSLGTLLALPFIVSIILFVVKLFKR